MKSKAPADEKDGATNTSTTTHHNELLFFAVISAGTPYVLMHEPVRRLFEMVCSQLLAELISAKFKSVELNNLLAVGFLSSRESRGRQRAAEDDGRGNREPQEWDKN